VAALSVVTAGVIGAALNAGVVASTFLPGAPHVPPIVATTLGMATFPIVVGAMLLVQSISIDVRWQSWVEQKQLVAKLPLSARLVAAGVFSAGLLISLTSMLTGGSSGSPEVIEGRYALTYKGGITIVTEAEYTQALLREIRIFAGGAMALQAGGATLAAAAARGGPARRTGP
jgi:hypothetical protein